MHRKPQGATRRTEVDVAAEAVTGLAADLASLPSWTLNEGQLADLEMLLSGAFAPLAGFMTAAEVASVCESGTLPDGTAWPVPKTVPGRPIGALLRRLSGLWRRETVRHRLATNAGDHGYP